MEDRKIVHIHKSWPETSTLFPLSNDKQHIVVSLTPKFLDLVSILFQFTASLSTRQLVHPSPNFVSSSSSLRYRPCLTVSQLYLQLQEPPMSFP